MFYVLLKPPLALLTHTTSFSQSYLVTGGVFSPIVCLISHASCFSLPCLSFWMVTKKALLSVDFTGIQASEQSLTAQRKRGGNSLWKICNLEKVDSHQSKVTSKSVWPSSFNLMPSRRGWEGAVGVIGCSFMLICGIVKKAAFAHMSSRHG